jgi:hypothetical protein
MYSSLPTSLIPRHSAHSLIFPFDTMDQTAIFKAADGGQVEVVRLLLDRGVPVDSQDKVSCSSYSNGQSKGIS